MILTLGSQPKSGQGKEEMGKEIQKAFQNEGMK